MVAATSVFITDWCPYTYLLSDTDHTVQFPVQRGGAQRHALKCMPICSLCCIIQCIRYLTTVCSMPFIFWSIQISPSTQVPGSTRHSTSLQRQYGIVIVMCVATLYYNLYLQCIATHWSALTTRYPRDHIMRIMPRAMQLKCASYGIALFFLLFIQYNHTLTHD